ncbi:hypothetical protein C7S15_2360 [Burkholderia cepacia]|nr:hypothetical protein [Burkholderia cepacia]
MYIHDVSPLLWIDGRFVKRDLPDRPRNGTERETELLVFALP